jgi:chromosome segregation ATPase
MQTAEVQQRLTEVRTAAAPWRAKLQSIREERDFAATQADLLRKSMTDSGKRLEEATAELQTTERDLGAHEAQLDDLKQAYAEHRAQLQEKGAALEQAKKAVDASSAAVSEAQGVVAGLANAMASAKTQGQVSKALQEAQKAQKIKVCICW